MRRHHELRILCNEESIMVKFELDAWLRIRAYIHSNVTAVAVLNQPTLNGANEGSG